MDYVVYTFGGGEALWKTFNGLALLFKSESAYMTSVLKLSLSIGAVWAALRAILGANAGLFARDYVVPVYLVFNLMLLPKTSVHIVDEINPDFHYSKVDHVPFGIALVASSASSISKLLTNIVESSLKTAEATHYGKTGPMFAARLVSMARDMRIIDPVERQNLKDFVRQCFTLPMVWSNVLAGKKAALETFDLLQLIADNPHSWLGSYWRTKGGNATFRYCKEGAVKAKEVLSVEVPSSLADLATGLFGSTQVNTVAASKRLKLYFDDAWQSVAHQTANAHQVAAQEMMMNIYRESSDDKRQEFGLERLHPHLIAASASRAKSQQNTGFLVSAQMMGSMLPSFQSTLLATLCLMFVVIVPMIFLPWGLSALGIWLQMILWVESWPIFYALINCVGMMMASNTGAAYVSTGGGLSLLTQNGLADAAYDAYCYAEGLMAIVTLIAWVVISKSGSALANLSATITRGVDGLSSKMGAEITDGNLNFDNQSFHNRSIAGYQLAQQQLGSSVGFGHKIDDGSKMVTWDTKGSPHIQETLTHLGTHVAMTDNMAATLRESGERSLSAAHQSSVMASKNFSQGLNELYGFSDQFSKGKLLAEGFGDNAHANLTEDLQTIKGFTDKYGKDHSMGDGKTVKVGGKGGLSFGKDGIASIGGDMGGHIHADDAEKISRIMNSDEGKRFSEALSRVTQYAKDHKGSLSDQSQMQAIENIQGNFQKAKQYSEQAQSSLTASESYKKTADKMESHGATISTFVDQQIIKNIADESFNGNEMQAYEWYDQNREAYNKRAAEFVRPNIQPFEDHLKTTHPMSEEQIRETAKKDFAKVSNTIGRSDIQHVKEIADQHNVGSSGRQQMEGDLSTLKGKTDTAFQSQNQKIETGRDNVNRGHKKMEKNYQDRSAHGVTYAAGKRLYNEGTQTAKDIGEGVKSVADWIGDQVKPDIIPSMNNSVPSEVTQSSAVKTPVFEGGEKMTASSFEQTGGKSTAQTDFVSPSSVRETSSGSRTGGESAPSSFGGTESRQNQSSGHSYETPAVRETSSGVQNDMQPSTYVRSMEDSIDQGRTANKMAAQGRQIKQLKDSIEMSKATLEEEAPLDMTPSQKVEN